ncbi:MAG TPA: carboxypeptidase-like regulatory domain-containing protein [Stellaceae bacterium]|nr:carboxypeptidase-like regulatory domain-containing protein [Stellaceae bacterium]
MPIALIRAAILAFALALASHAWAGGGSFGNDEDSGDQDSGPPFFGFVKDKGGDAIDDAKITVTVKNLNSSMILRTDSQGHYFVRGFDKSIDPDDVDIACGKDGYREIAHARKPASDPKAPVEVDCILDRQ